MYPCVQRGKPDAEEGGALSSVQSFKRKIMSLLAQDGTGCANPGPFFGRKFSASCVCGEKVEKCESLLEEREIQHDLSLCLTPRYGTSELSFL